MKYRMFTAVGDCLPIAYKLQQEGHEVVVGMVEDLRTTHSTSEGTIAAEEPEYKKRRLALYDGMVEKRRAEDLIKEMKTYKHPEEYFVFFDRNNLFFYAEQLIDLPFHGNFPTEKDYLFEQDREQAKKFVQKHYPKLHVAEVKAFTTVKEGAVFLKTTDALWVLKGNSDAVKTFVPDVEDAQLAALQLLQALNDNQDEYDKYGYILEELVSPVIEITPEKIYYNGQPLAVTLDFENKPFGSGNISIQTGCAQDLVFPISMDDKIASIAFPPIVDELAKQHKGLFIWDASLLINKRTGRIYFGEFCSNRPGYNSLFTELSQLPSVSSYFEKIIAGESPFILGTVGTSVLLLNQERDEALVDHTVSNSHIAFMLEVEKNLWLWDVRRKGKQTVTVGDDWNLAVVTGAGASIEDAVQHMYRAVDGFSFAGAYYRPKSDFVSLEYPTSILNRVNYGLKHDLYRLPFNVRVAESVA